MVKANNFLYKHSIEKSPKASQGYLKLLALKVNKRLHQGFDAEKFCEKHGIKQHHA